MNLASLSLILASQEDTQCDNDPSRLDTPLGLSYFSPKNNALDLLLCSDRTIPEEVSPLCERYDKSCVQKTSAHICEPITHNFLLTIYAQINIDTRCAPENNQRDYMLSLSIERRIIGIRLSDDYSNSNEAKRLSAANRIV